MRALSLTLLCIFAAGLVLAQNSREDPAQEALEEEAMKDCEANQANMNLCSYRAYKDLDGVLNFFYKEQMARVKNTEHEIRLRQAQRAWLKFIEADCLYQAGGPRENSGTMWPLLYNRCLSEHLEQRIAELKAFLRCRENPCPGAE